MNAQLASQLDVSLRRAVAFLQRSQLPHGEFAGLVATDPDLHDGVLESSPFFTTFVLYALNHLKTLPVGGMIDKAVSGIIRRANTSITAFRRISTTQHV